MAECLEKRAVTHTARQQQQQIHNANRVDSAWQAVCGGVDSETTELSVVPPAFPALVFLSVLTADQIQTMAVSVEVAEKSVLNESHAAFTINNQAIQSVCLLNHSDNALAPPAWQRRHTYERVGFLHT